MAYKIEWDKKAGRFLSKLPSAVSRRIAHKVQQLQDHPFVYLEHYEGKRLFKLRVGDYRVLVDVDHKERIIAVRVMGHRRNVYLGE